ncbi:hypothetical protein [Streptomyces sp. NPDC050145]|uniref:hypothetical protein n=1 Tax=Streptomyces sp. NPDC050145 TaxID=3365602 RepID=UPI0037BD47CC
MEIEIAVPGDDGHRALAEVRGVLEGHPAMRGVVVRPALARGPADDERLQGGMSTFEVVNAVLSQASGYGGLAVALYSALRGRRAGGGNSGGPGGGSSGGTGGPASSTLTVTRAGTEVSVTVHRDLTPAEIEQLLRSLEGQADRDGAPGPTPPLPGA